MVHTITWGAKYCVAGLLHTNLFGQRKYREKNARNEIKFGEGNNLVPVHVRVVLRVLVYVYNIYWVFFLYSRILHAS